MADGTTAVDFLTLEQFQTRVENHLNAAGELFSSMTRDLLDGPQLGEFRDAVNANEAYWERWAVQYDRIHRLCDALSAANEATKQILAQYKTTDELNHAKLSDLSSQFASLSIATDGLTDAI
jgi:hypothetical protein